MKKSFVWFASIVAFAPLLFLVLSNSANVLCWDQWDYYNVFFQHRGFWAIFDYQHGHHRMGLGGLIMWITNTVTGWDMEMLSLVTVIGIFQIALFLLWITRRINGKVAFADACVAIATLTLTQLDTALANNSLAQVVVPSLLMLIYAITWSTPSSVVKTLSLAALQFVMLFSGYGITFFPVTVMLIVGSIWRPNKLMPYEPANFLLLTSAVSSMVYFYGLVDCFTPYLRFEPMAIARYLFKFGAMFSGIDGVAGDVVGAAFISALAFICARSAWRFYRREKNDSVQFFVSACALAYICDSAIGRTAVASRYMTITAIGFASIYIASKQNLAVGLIVAVLALNGSVTTWQTRSTNSVILTTQRCQNFIDCYKVTGDALACNASYVVYPNPKATHMEKKLEFLKQNGLGFFR